jgi:FkbM family methyltransferase
MPTKDRAVLACIVVVALFCFGLLTVSAPVPGDVGLHVDEHKAPRGDVMNAAEPSSEPSKPPALVKKPGALSDGLRFTPTLLAQGEDDWHPALVKASGFLQLQNAHVAGPRNAGWPDTPPGTVNLGRLDSAGKYIDTGSTTEVIVEVGPNTNPDLLRMVQQNSDRYFVMLEPGVPTALHNLCYRQLAGRCLLLPVAAGPRNTYLTFNIAAHNKCSTVLEGATGCGAHSRPLNVPAMTLDTVLGLLPPHLPVRFIMLDCQGVDLAVLAGLRRHRPRVANLCLECQDLPLQHPLFISPRSSSCGQAISCVRDQMPGFRLSRCWPNSPHVGELNCMFHNVFNPLAHPPILYLPPLSTTLVKKGYASFAVEHPRECPAYFDFAASSIAVVSRSDIEAGYTAAWVGNRSGVDSLVLRGAPDDLVGDADFFGHFQLKMAENASIVVLESREYLEPRLTSVLHDDGAFAPVVLVSTVASCADLRYNGACTLVPAVMRADPAHERTVTLASVVDRVHPAVPISSVWLEGRALDALRHAPASAIDRIASIVITCADVKDPVPGSLTCSEAAVCYSQRFTLQGCRLLPRAESAPGTLKRVPEKELLRRWWGEPTNTESDYMQCAFGAPRMPVEFQRPGYAPFADFVMHRLPCRWTEAIGCPWDS